MASDTATKDDLFKVEKDLKEDINEIKEEVSKIWQGFETVRDRLPAGWVFVIASLSSAVGFLLKWIMELI